MIVTTRVETNESLTITRLFQRRLRATSAAAAAGRLTLKRRRRRQTRARNRRGEGEDARNHHDANSQWSMRIGGEVYRDAAR